MIKKFLKAGLSLALALSLTSNVFAADLPATSLAPWRTDIDWVGNDEWKPADSINDMINKSSVEKVDRSQGAVVNPLASEQAKIQVLSLMNKKGEGTTSVGGPEFKAYTFDFWQYVDSMIFWEGPIPTPDVIDAAHRNGVAIYGNLFFNWSTSDQDNEKFAKFIEEDTPGSKTFPSARNLAKAAKYYGFDGYFINQETVGWATSGKSQQMVDLMHYMKDYAREELDYPIRISWYDAMANSGYRNHINGVSYENNMFVKARPDGQAPADEFFMNFNWTSSKIATTERVMREMGRSPFDAYAGFELQAGSYNTLIRRNELVGSDKKLRTSLGLFTPDSIQGLSLDGEDYHEQERKFWTGFGGDPTTSDDSYKWSGMARYVRDSTPITSLPFNTFFNTGHGRGYFIDGKKSKTADWNQRSVQEILPTWRWWVRSNTDTKITPRFDFDDAYNGPNSVAFEGNLKAGSTNDVMLYSTDVTLSPASKLILTYKGGANSAIKVGLSNDKNYSLDSFTFYDLEAGKDEWGTQTIDLSNLAGQNIRAIKLQFANENEASNYKFNLGQVAIVDDTTNVGNVSNVEVLNTMVHSARKAEAIIKFDRVAGAAYYEVFQNVGGNLEEVTASSSNYIYVPGLRRTEGNVGTVQELYVRAVGENGTRSELASTTVDYEMTINDTEEVKPESENVVLGAKVLRVNAENPGELGRNALNGTITGNSDKWCNNYSQGSWLEIELTEPRTVKRWVMDHAGAGGEDPYRPEEGLGGSMNTKNFKISYKVNPEDQWTELKAIYNNKLNVTDVSFDNEVEAKYYRLDIMQAHNGTPWGATRIYNWKMYEQKADPSTDPIPMPYVSASHTREDLYDINFAEVPANTTVKIYADRELTKELGSYKADEKGPHTFTDVKLEGGKGLVYYTSTEEGKEASPVFAVVYTTSDRELTSIRVKNLPTVLYAKGESLDLANGSLEIEYTNGTKDTVQMTNDNVAVTGYDPNKLGKQTLKVTYLEKETTFEVEVKTLDELSTTIKSIKLPADFKTTYDLDDELDMNSKLTVNFYRGKPIEVALSDKDVRVTGFDSSKEGRGVITISYKGQTLEVNYSVTKPTINYQRLQQKIAEVEGVMETEAYKNATPASRKALDQKLEEARALEDNARKQVDVDNMVVALDKSVSDLVALANKDRLESTLEQANDKLSRNYTKESLDQLKLVIIDAQKVFDDANASQTDVNKASSNLVRAIFGLKRDKPVDKSDLDKLVKEADAKLPEIRKGSYTAQSVKDYELALANAKEALAKDVNKDTLEKAIAELNNAKVGLKLKSNVDKSKLTNLVAKAEKYNLSKYNDKDKVKAFTTELENAKKVLNDEGASANDVNLAYNKLLKSMFGLK